MFPVAADGAESCTIKNQEKDPSAPQGDTGNIMSLWLNAYLRAIEERDSKERANESLFGTCVL